MSLTAAITSLVSVASGLSGMGRAYTDPPESISEFPAAVVYAERGELFGISSGLSRNLHTIRMDLYAERTQLPEAVNKGRTWPDAVLVALRADQTLGGAVDTIVWPVVYQAIAAEYNNIVHYGIRFEITVKDMEAV